MYDLFTVALLFVVLSPGVVLNLGSSALMSALIHAVVFYLVLRFVSAYVPWWGVWIVAGLAIGSKLYAGRTATV
jgi:hypothetical protein